jgi:acylphosphatase
MKAVRLVISGRVQGVGYRDWLVRRAAALGVHGWVRNLGCAQVECVICGEADAVGAALRACRHGPPAAHVDDVVCTDIETLSDIGFRRLPSV